jgi:hypothetical protein
MTEPAPGLPVVLKDALQEAECALAQLREVAELLQKEQYLQAVGAFDGLEDRVHYVGTVLSRYARATGLRR